MKFLQEKLERIKNHQRGSLELHDRGKWWILSWRATLAKARENGEDETDLEARGMGVVFIFLLNPIARHFLEV